MTEAKARDRELVCVDCGAPFRFAVEEQRYFELNDFAEPRRCRACRKRRRERRGERESGL